MPASLKPAGGAHRRGDAHVDREIRQQQRVGVLEFTLKGQPLTLGAFVEAGADLQTVCSCRSAT